MNHYELMVILNPTLIENNHKAAIEKYVSFVKANGGKIVNENFWGSKALAFPIQKQSIGLYFVLEYQADADFNQALKTQILRDDAILRHLITKLDKYAVAYNEKKTQ